MQFYLYTTFLVIGCMLTTNDVMAQYRIAVTYDNQTLLLDEQAKPEFLPKEKTLKEAAIIQPTIILRFKEQVSENVPIKKGWTFCNALQSPHDEQWVYLQRFEFNQNFSLQVFEANAFVSRQLFDQDNAPESGLGFKPIAWSNHPDIIFLEAFVFDDALDHEGIWSYHIKTGVAKKLAIAEQSYSCTPLISPDRKHLVYTADAQVPKIQLHGSAELLYLYDIEQNVARQLFNAGTHIHLGGWVNASVPESDMINRSAYTPAVQYKPNATVSLLLPWASGVTRCVTRDGSDTPPGTPGAGSAGYGNCNLGNHGYPAAYDFDTNNFSDEVMLASADGEVVVANYSSQSGGYSPTGYGNWVVIRHSNDYRTLYAHLSSVSVAVGEQVAAGCFIGYEGTTGQSTGDHLHYEYEYPGGASGNLYHDFSDCGCYPHKGYNYTSGNVQGACDPCVLNLTLDADDAIPPPTVEDITAENYIILSTGFEAGYGSTADLRIEPCNNLVEQDSTVQGQ